MEILVGTRTDVGKEKEQGRVYPPKKGVRKGSVKEHKAGRVRKSNKKQEMEPGGYSDGGPPFLQYIYLLKELLGSAVSTSFSSNPPLFPSHPCVSEAGAAAFT